MVFKTLMDIRVGLESHIELDLNRKLFCRCLRSQNCDTCMGKPGAIPVFSNKKALNKTKTLASFLESKIADRLYYDRKHYYYMDNPKNYQLSQQRAPLALGGSLLLLRSNFCVHFKKIILEEDPAAYDKGIIDYSRAGRAIIELVTEPCFQGSEEYIKPKLKQYLQTLRRLCIDLGLSKDTMVLKSDVNVSLKGSTNRLEIKNVSSIYDILDSLGKARKILENEEIKGVQTYHYAAKNLIYSRPKTDYFFYKEPNLRPIKLVKDVSSRPKLLYDYTKKLKEANLEEPFEKIYAYSKVLFQKGIEPMGLFMDLKQGSLKLRAKLDNEVECKEKIQNFLIDYPLKWVDYIQKSVCYLNWLKSLKKFLKEINVSFNSKYIQEVLNISKDSFLIQ